MNAKAAQKGGGDNTSNTTIARKGIADADSAIGVVLRVVSEYANGHYVTLPTCDSPKWKIKLTSGSGNYECNGKKKKKNIVANFSHG